MSDRYYAVMAPGQDRCPMRSNRLRGLTQRIGRTGLTSPTTDVPGFCQNAVMCERNRQFRKLLCCTETCQTVARILARDAGDHAPHLLPTNLMLSPSFPTAPTADLESSWW